MSRKKESMKAGRYGKKQVRMYIKALKQEIKKEHNLIFCDICITPHGLRVDFSQNGIKLQTMIAEISYEHSFNYYRKTTRRIIKQDIVMYII